MLNGLLLCCLFFTVINSVIATVTLLLMRQQIDRIRLLSNKCDDDRLARACGLHAVPDDPP